MDAAEFRKVLDRFYSDLEASERDLEDISVCTSPPTSSNEPDREILGIELVDDFMVLNIGDAI